MRQCLLCSKKANKANARSHSNEASLRRQYANLVSKKINGRKVMVCTTCLRTRTKYGKG